MKNKAWLAEEKGQPYFPFAHNAPFGIIINVEAKQFKVTIIEQNRLGFTPTEFSAFIEGMHSL